MSGYVTFTLSKEMMPDSFDGSDRTKFSNWEFKMSNFLSAGDYEHAGDILEWIAQEQEDVAEDTFDRIAAQRGWDGQARDHASFSMYLFTVLSSRTDGTPHRSVRNGRHKDGVNAWRRLHMEYGPVTSATAQGFMKKSLENPRAKTTSDVSSAVQLLEELVRKYEEHRDKEYDHDLKLQRLCEQLPKPIERQLVLEDRDGSATFESVKRRANNWILMNRRDERTWTCGRWKTEETAKTTMEDKTGTRQETRWD